MHPDWVVPDWDVPAGVRAFVTTRAGGVSGGPFAAPDGGGMNVGLASGDERDVVIENRRRLRAALPSEPYWLRQVHGATVVNAARLNGPVGADAAFTAEAGVVCVVSVADCMPVFLADDKVRCVAVAHAGWRGMAAGVIQNTVRAMREHLRDPDARIVAWLGPAIGPARFEVEVDVLAAMCVLLPLAAEAFTAIGNGKFVASLPVLARQALSQVEVVDVTGGDVCTYSDPLRFYSYRRDRVTGRHAAVIWLDR
jgi:YfiH family protein